jgi:hypothetical protein
VPDDLDLPTDEAIDYAQRLLDEGRAFGAHEAAGLGPFRSTTPHGLRVDDLARAGDRLAAEIDAGRVPAVPQLRLRG